MEYQVEKISGQFVDNKNDSWSWRVNLAIRSSDNFNSVEEAEAAMKDQMPKILTKIEDQKHEWIQVTNKPPVVPEIEIKKDEDENPPDNAA